MSAQFDAIAQQALRLSESDRHWLAERLWWSLELSMKIEGEWDTALARPLGVLGSSADLNRRSEPASAASDQDTGPEMQATSDDAAALSPLHAVTIAALRFASAEREALALRLWASIDDPAVVAAEWDAEIERRIIEMEAGTVEWVSSEEVFARLQARVKDRGAS